MGFRPGYTSLDLGIRLYIISVVFDEESEFSGPRTPNLSLDQGLRKTYPIKICVLICFSPYRFFHLFRGLHKKTSVRERLHALKSRCAHLSTQGRETTRQLGSRPWLAEGQILSKIQ